MSPEQTIEYLHEAIALIKESAENAKQLGFETNDMCHMKLEGFNPYGRADCDRGLPKDFYPWTDVRMTLWVRSYYKNPTDSPAS